MSSSILQALRKGTSGPSSGKLGTFLGVFTPSLLTILGVILFLRMGWVVGSVGLVPALAIVVLANAITIATALSVSAVATNMHVGAGGAYYIISRSLGIEIGGAIGIPLFLAQTFSVTLYAFGLAESLQLLWPALPQRPVAALTVLSVALLAGRGAQLALRLQIPIMAAIVVALLSFFGGVAGQAGDTLALWSGVQDAAPFWVVFAVFFPAVTGIMAGISLSGDLEEPKRSIPRGTLAAVLVGFVIYLSVPIAIAIAADSATLVKDNLIWFKVAVVPVLIFPGLWGAIFSSAVGSILGAPRTLEALADDRVLPAFSRRKKARRKRSQNGAAGIPHLISVGVALAAVGLGDLNAVAPVLTMFFLTTYGMVNLVAGLEQLSGAPSYRPTIRVPWVISLAGAAGCFWVMWLINRWAAIAAVIVEIGIYVALRRRSMQASWGDLRYGALMSLTRASMLKLRHLPVDPRNWRPNILVFAGDLEKRLELVRFAAWLNQDRGILTVCDLIVGDLEEIAPSLPERNRVMSRQLESEGLTAFSEVDVVMNLEHGALAVAQANGIAGVTSNTLMFGWADETEGLASLIRIQRRAVRLAKSTVICRIAPRRWSARFRRIDVWWGGLQNNGDMLLLFAHLLSLNPEWLGVEICINNIVGPGESIEHSRAALGELIERVRINATAQVLERSAEQSILDVIHERSRDADLVFTGLQEVARGEEIAYAERLQALVDTLPTVVLVRAAGPFAGQLL